MIELWLKIHNLNFISIINTLKHYKWWFISAWIWNDIGDMSRLGEYLLLICISLLKCFFGVFEILGQFGGKCEWGQKMCFCVLGDVNVIWDNF